MSFANIAVQVMVFTDDVEGLWAKSSRRQTDLRQSWTGTQVVPLAVGSKIYRLKQILVDERTVRVSQERVLFFLSSIFFKNN